MDINNTIPNMPVIGYTLPTSFSKGNSPQKNANTEIIIAIRLELYFPFLENLSHIVQKFGAAVEKILPNKIIEKIVPNKGDIDFAKYKVGIDNL